MRPGLYDVVGDSLPDSWLQEECERTAKQNARNQYMRFWRSIQSNGKAPPHLLSHYEQIKGRKGALTLLFEDYVQAKEDWQRPEVSRRLL